MCLFFNKKIAFIKYMEILEKVRNIIKNKFNTELVIGITFIQRNMVFLVMEERLQKGARKPYKMDIIQSKGLIRKGLTPL